MMNSLEKAREWVSLLAGTVEVPFGAKLEAHFGAGHIVRLCECGCNSFDLEIDPKVTLEPLCEPSAHGGVFFEVAFESTGEFEVDCLFFADKRGYLAGIDITHGDSNQAQMPGDIKVGRVQHVVDYVAIAKKRLTHRP
jgi:hypothetical protein